MKKKLMAFLLVMIFAMAGICAGKMEVQAEEDYDVSYVALDNALIGYTENQTRGVYLMDGYSIINDAGNGRIGCGGETNAARRCTVSANVVVERKVDGSWLRVTDFSKTSENALSVTVSRYLYVAGGYYYRARTMHYAGSDSSASSTNALWMY